VRKDGTVMPVLVNATAIKDESGNYLMSRSTVFDITEIKRLRDIVTESEKKFRTILEEMNDAYFEVDPVGNYTFVNNRLCEMLLYSWEELMGMNYRHFIAEEDFKDIYSAYNKVYRTGESNKGVVMKAIRKDGTTWYIECSISPLRNQQGKIIGFRSVGRDVSERVELQNKLAQMAMHDGLTGLPNRVLLNDRFEMAVARAQRNKKKLSVMILDLDKFKLINDTLGHGTGDGLLKSVAARLSDMVRKSDTVARIGGDEFVVLLPETSLPRDAVNTAQKIVKAFSKSFTVDGHDLNVTTSIGIAIYPENGNDMESLLKKADTAMYFAKEHGRNSYKLAGD
jgi:diguanylate cyclase (GGDEF)-like protein/PAS domain S-box-containing protein